MDILRRADAGSSGSGLSLCLAAVIVALAAGGESVYAETAAGESPDAAAAPRIVPTTVAPARAAAALQEARAAMDARDWVKAGGLFEGLLQLGSSPLKDDDQRDAAQRLATCYLQTGDARGAADALAVRARLTADEKEKKRVLAAAEALKTFNNVRIGDKTARTYEDALAAGTEWKARKTVETARTIAEQARMFSVKERLERSAQMCLDKLAEADVYVADAGTSHRKEFLGLMVTHLLNQAKRIMQNLTQEREFLNKNRWASLVDQDKMWTNRVLAYLEARQEAEESLGNLKPFAEKFKAADLYSQAEVDDLLKTFTELRFYPGGDAKHRLRILPRKTGGSGR